MGGANQFRNSSGKRVNVNTCICGQVSSFYRPVLLPSFVCSGTMVIEFNDKINGTQITFDLFCALKSLKVLKLKAG